MIGLDDWSVLTRCCTDGPRPAPARSLLRLLLLGVTVFTILIGQMTTGRARERCPEGRTSSGMCVDAALAADARRLAIIASQPRLSETILPVLPSRDAIDRDARPIPSRPAPTGTLAPN